MAQGVIAVLDGDWGCRALFDDVLTGMGYHTVLWEPETDPFALIARCQPSLLILDTWLEVRHDGWALLQRLWHNPATAAIPVLVCTSDARWQPEARAGQDHQGYTVLEKPFDLADLLERVTAVLVPLGAAGGAGAAPLPPDGEQPRSSVVGVVARRVPAIETAAAGAVGATRLRLLARTTRPPETSRLHPLRCRAVRSGKHP